MNANLEEKIFIANNRPFLSLKTIKAETVIIENEYLTEFNFYEEGFSEDIDPESYYNGISLTMVFEDLGKNPETPVIGYDKFAQICDIDMDGVNCVFPATPYYLTPMKKVSDHTYMTNVDFVCSPAGENDDDFEVFEKQFENKEMNVILNIVCENDFVRESFETIGRVVFDGAEHDAANFTKDRRSYSVIERDANEA